MSHNDFIRTLTGIKDPNINFSQEISNDSKRKGLRCMVIKATLTYQPECCTSCGTLFDEKVVKNGFLNTKIQFGKSPEAIPMWIDLKKQRFLCRHCNSSFLAESEIVNKYCALSNHLKFMIFNDATKKRSEVDIAHDNCVSHSTVNRTIHQTYDEKTLNLNWLPAAICMDEFKSTPDADGAMSFIYCDAENGNIIDIVEDRRLGNLINYFRRFPRKTRCMVKHIVIDMYAPYMSLIQKMFPCAKIIIDKFHVVQLINNALNKTRIKIMNEQSEHYNKFKNYWKLLLRFEEELNYQTYFYSKCFGRKMNQTKIVAFLLSIDEELAETYKIYQKLLQAIRNRNFDLFESTVNEKIENCSSYMAKSLKTLKKYLPYVKSMMETNYTNGVIEGTINQIKVIKRIAFGYRSFYHFKARILMIHQYNQVRLLRQMKKRKLALKQKINSKNQAAA